MALEVSSDGSITQQATVAGIVFKNRDTDDIVSMAVIDKYPQMQDVHIEGRRVIEISVELMVQLMGHEGYDVVDPSKLGDNEEYAEPLEEEDA